MVAITSAGASSRSVVSDSAISAKDTKGTKNTQVRMHRKQRVRVSDASTGAAGRDVDLSAPIAPSIQSPLLMRVRFDRSTAKRAKKDRSTAKPAKRAKKDQSTAKTAKRAKKDRSSAKTAKRAKQDQTSERDAKRARQARPR